MLQSTRLTRKQSRLFSNGNQITDKYCQNGTHKSISNLVPPSPEEEGNPRRNPAKQNVDEAKHGESE